MIDTENQQEPITSELTKSTDVVVPIQSTVPITRGPFVSFNDIPSYDRECPFTGHPTGLVAWQDPDKDDGTPGFCHAVSHDGSHIHGVDMDGIEREISTVKAITTRVNELKAQHGTFVDAHYNYSKQIKDHKDQISAIRTQIESTEKNIKLLEAHEIVNQGTVDIQPTPSISETKNSLGLLQTKLAELNNWLENNEPNYGRVTGELAAYASQERGF